MEPVRVAFLGWFGAHNLGNECTLQTIIYNLRRYLPDAELKCVCVEPDDTEARHGIAATLIAEPFPTVGSSKSRLVRNNPVAKTLGKIWFRILRIPIGLLGWLKAFRTLKGTHMLIVPGTGLLTDAYARPFGWPYYIFKWSLTAKLCGCRLLFVSVGAGPIYHPLSRWFIKSALSMADYRSYREDSTFQYLTSIGFATNKDRVFPDLAFNLPANLLPDGDVRNGQRPVVGIGLMHYAGRLSVDSPGNATYVAYLQTLAQFVEWLLARQYDISLLVGDASNDIHVVQEFKDLLKRRGSFDQSRIIDALILTVEDVLARLAETDAVVATRFHNALLALVLNKPVIMISFHHKCDSLMNQMDLSEYCEDIHHVTTDRLIERFVQLEQNAEALKDLIKRKVEQQRQALEEQYEIIFRQNCPIEWTTSAQEVPAIRSSQN
jgi:polysaccharide pyruvyl transferase WcaK-like protein